jgi:hypothetical protein
MRVAGQSATIRKIREARRAVADYVAGMRKTVLAILLVLAAVAANAAEPETVMVTYRPKKGSETKLAEVVARQWVTLQQLGLVTSERRELYRAGSMLIEVFTWKDAAVPDNPPAEVRALWDEMGKLVEKNGISILQVGRVRE